MCEGRIVAAQPPICQALARPDAAAATTALETTEAGTTTPAINGSSARTQIPTHNPPDAEPGTELQTIASVVHQGDSQGSPVAALDIDDG